MLKKHIFKKAILAIVVYTIGLLFIGTTNADNNNNFGSGGDTYTAGYGVIGAGNMTETDGNVRIIKTVQNAINRVLGILGLIALILCLRGGFQMLTAAGDDSKVKSGTKVLKHAAIGLAVIGLSWLVVTFIFYLINRNAVPGT